MAPAFGKEPFRLDSSGLYPAGVKLGSLPLFTSGGALGLVG